VLRIAGGFTSLSERMMIYGLAVALFCLSFADDLVALIRDPSWTILAGMLVGWAVIDFGSGVVHMLFDYVALPARFRMDLLYFAERRDSEEYRQLRRSILGAVNPFWRITFDFKYHHPRPNALGRRSLKQLTADTLIFAGLPLSLALNFAVAEGEASPFVVACGSTVVIGAVFIQYFHAALHRPQPPTIVAVMRRLHLLMTPQAHQRHHDVQDNGFAIIAGWTNPLLDRIFLALRAAGLLRIESLEPPRSEATRDLETARHRSHVQATSDDIGGAGRR
jgi:hypothetical protein